MGFFSGAEKVSAALAHSQQVGERYPNLKEKAGTYRLRLRRAVTFEGGDGETYFKAELEVLDSTGGWQKGDIVTDFQAKAKFDMHLKHIIKLLAALSVTPVASIGSAQLEEFTGPDNPAAGLEVIAEVAPQPDAPQYNRITYSSTPEAIAKVNAPVGKKTKTNGATAAAV